MIDSAPQMPLLRKPLPTLLLLFLRLPQAVPLAFPPPSYVVLGNLQSGGNIGRIIRSASIFGVSECVVVGQRKWPIMGDHGSRFDVPQRHFYDHKCAADYLKDERGATIVGVEITDDSKPLAAIDPETGRLTVPWLQTGDGTGANQGKAVAFVLGNEGSGLSQRFRAICDDFVYIPQVRGGSGGGGGSSGGGSGGGSSSLNVACAAAVVLQMHALVAGFEEAPRQGEKFLQQPLTDTDI